MSALDHWPPQFVRLTLRRLLPIGAWIPILICIVLALAGDHTGASSLGPGEVESSLASARTRQALWSVLLFLAGPLLVVGAARSFRHWSRADADWFASVPPARGHWASLTSVSTGCAVLVLCVATATLAELRAPSPTPALHWKRTLEHPSSALVAGDPPIRWSAPDVDLSHAAGAARALLVARPTVAPGSGPGVTVRFSAHVDGVEAARIEARIFGRSELHLRVPSAPSTGAAALQLELARVGDGAICVLPPRSVDLFESVHTPRLGSLILCLRGLLALGAATLLAAGLGAWMRAGLAAGTTFALATLPGAWSPYAQLFAAWRLAGAGYVPAGPSTGEWFAALCAGLVGYALLRSGTARGRALA